MGDQDDGYASLLELQRRAFEKQFGSLESLGYEDKTKTAPKAETDSDGQDDNVAGSMSSGEESVDSSDEGSENAPEEGSSEQQDVGRPRYVRQPRIIKFNGSSDQYVPPTKEDVKQLRTGKSLKLHQPRAVTTAKESPAEGSDDEAENLKNDIELQRFLSESHLLSAFNSGGYDNQSVTGNARARTLETRLKDLSSTNGNAAKLNKLEKVPINVRKGMISNHMKKIANFEKDAKDAGVVLSHIKKGQYRKIGATYRNDIERRIGTSVGKQQAGSTKKRQRGLKIQSVGQSTRNGLVISRSEIDRINNRKQ